MSERDVYEDCISIIQHTGGDDQWCNKDDVIARIRNQGVHWQQDEVEKPVNITNGVPPEIWVAIGRGRYDHDGGDMELAMDVASAVNENCRAELERLRSDRPQEVKR